MDDNDAPPPPLPSIAVSRSTKKKRGRPSESRDKEKGYKRVRREMAGVNMAFETAFGHIHTTEMVEVANEGDEISQNKEPQNQDEDNFGIAVHMVDHEDDDKYVNSEVEDLFNNNEGNVGFESLDFYDVKELIELSLEDADIGAKDESQDEVKQVKKGLHWEEL